MKILMKLAILLLIVSSNVLRADNAKERSIIYLKNGNQVGAPNNDDQAGVPNNYNPIKSPNGVIQIGSSSQWLGQETIEVAPSFERPPYPSVRVITEDELNGTDTITMKINELLVIPLYYRFTFYPLGHTLKCNLNDSSVVQAQVVGNTYVNSNTLYFNFVCIGLKPGQADLWINNGILYSNKLSFKVIE